MVVVNKRSSIKKIVKLNLLSKCSIKCCDESFRNAICRLFLSLWPFSYVTGHGLQILSSFWLRKKTHELSLYSPVAATLSSCLSFIKLTHIPHRVHLSVAVTKIWNLKKKILFLLHGDWRRCNSSTVRLSYISRCYSVRVLFVTKLEIKNSDVCICLTQIGVMKIWEFLFNIKTGQIWRNLNVFLTDFGL